MKEKNIITKNPIAALIEQINEAKKGSFVVFTNYRGTDGKVQTIYGNLKMSYEDVKEKAIADLLEAIKANDFEDVTVKGECRYDKETDVYNGRKKSWPMEKYEITYKASEVLAMAKSILYDWQNPKERANNNLSLGADDGSVVYNEESENFNVRVMVAKTVYKEELSTDDGKIKATAPETKLKDSIRDRFMKKIKTLTIGSNNCEKISLNAVEIIL
jgi:hypothetical protein